MSQLVPGISLPNASWIGGSWREGNVTFDSETPAEGVTIANLTQATTSDVDDAIASARRAFEQFRREPTAVRAGWCRSIAAAIRDEREALASTLSLEHGKPISEALAEVSSAALGFEVAAETAVAAGGEVPNVRDPHKRVVVRREGLGVWAVITPWNFPVNIPVEYLGYSVAAGNAAVWKPAPTTAAVAALFRQVLLKADFPQELIQLILTDRVEVASHLVTHPGIVAVGFTGGSGTGEAIARSAWDKKLLLELGGNSPVVVLPDADLELAAAAIANSAFFNAGQVCSAAGKILAVGGSAGELGALLAERAGHIVIGSPLDAATTLGPVHLKGSIKRIDGLIADAAGRGAAVLTGGERVSDRPGYFYPATVLTNVDPAAEIFTQETFGPVASITSFTDEDEMIAAANLGSFGLVGSLFTTSLSKAFEVAERIDCGLVSVNESSNYWELNLPFGGAAGTRSGRGRLGGRWALEEFSQTKAIALDIRR